jgi:transcriptional regulator with XRE-family HTH domain
MAKRMMDVLKALTPEDPTPGQMLRVMRKRDGFSLDDMAEITGIKVPNLSSLENDRTPMTRQYAEKMAAALRVHPTIFLYPNGAFAMDEELLAIERRARAFLKRHG